MKKFILAVLVISLFAFPAFAKKGGYGQPPADQSYQQGYGTQLPDEITSFINRHFRGASISYVKFDWDEYEVYLSDGSEIDFNRLTKNWKKIKSYQKPVPDSVLPAPVLGAVKNLHPGAYIIKAEKEWSSYDIKLSNRIEIHVSDNGKILKHKFD